MIALTCGRVNYPFHFKVGKHCLFMLGNVFSSSVLLAEATVLQYALAYSIHPERPSLRSWFTRTPKEPRDPKKIKELKQFLMDLLLALFFGVAPFPVFWKWIGWLCCFFIFLYIVQSAVDSIHERPLKTRLVGGVLLAAGFVAAVSTPARAMWMEEGSLVKSGQLCVWRSWKGVCYTPPIPIIEIGGDSGSKFIYVGAENSVDFGRFARNAGLRIERGATGMEISTPVLDRSGKKIANIDKNHWTVLNQPEIWDKNYSDNALEIKDSRGEVVLQLRYLPDRLQIAAEWRDQFGRGQEWAKCGAPGKPATGCVIPWGDARTELQNEVAIEPIFQYPSSEHLGEFVKKK
jgi:hypothetical protein